MLKRFPLSRSILLAFSILYMGVTIIICLILNQYFHNNIVRQNQQHLEARAVSVAQQLDAMIDDMNLISVKMYYSDTIINAFSGTLRNMDGGNYFTKDVQANSLMESGIYPIVGTEITDIIVNMYNDRGFYSSKYYTVSWEKVLQLLEDGYLAEVASELKESNNLPVISFVDDTYWSQDNVSRGSYISVSRYFRNYRTQKIIGVIEILMPEKKIKKLLQNGGTDQTTLLLDENGNVICASQTPDEVISENISEILEKGKNVEEKNAFFKVGSDKYYYGSQTMNKGGMTVISVRRYDNREYIEYSMIVVCAGLALYLLTLFMSFYISKRLSRPLDKIVVSLKDASWDKLEMNLDLDSSYGDFDILEKSYSAMMVKLHESINLVVDSRLNERKATYLALQSQISPHFIYNIIASISACAYENGVYKIVDICDKLSGLLRYATDYCEDFSDIDSEMEYTENYLELMKVRYENRFFYSISCSEECRSVHIPRLITQTVIENCFKHSFKNVDEPWFISVAAYLEDGWWLIDITHNGDAISPKQLDEILCQSEKIYHDIAHGLEGLNLGGLGLLNSITRLKMLYNSMRFEVQRNEDGTNVTRFGGKLK